MVINFPEADKIFCDQYLSLEPEKAYDLVLANWRVEERDKFEKPQERETVIAFDVLKIDGEEYPQGAKVWRTTSKRFYEAAKPILLKAQAQNISAVNLLVTYTKTNNYNVIDLKKAMGATQ